VVLVGLGFRGPEWRGLLNVADVTVADEPTPASVTGTWTDQTIICTGTGFVPRERPAARK
jgi:hypothetical protein